MTKNPFDYNPNLVTKITSPMRNPFNKKNSPSVSNQIFNFLWNIYLIKKKKKK